MMSTTSKEVFKEFQNKHNGNYEQSSYIEYSDSPRPITIICAKHGEFSQSDNPPTSCKKCDNS